MDRRVGFGIGLVFVLWIGCQGSSSTRDAAAPDTGTVGGSGSPGVGGMTGGIGGAETGLAGATGTAGIQGTGLAGVNGAADGGIAGAGPTGLAGSNGGAGIGAAGISGGAGCDKDLTGVWDLVATRGYAPSTGILTISASGLSIELGTHKLVYLATPSKSVTWKAGDRTSTLAVQNVPAGLDTGSIPLVAGGSWVFSGPQDSCTVSLADGAVSGKCTTSCQGCDISDGTWPSSIGRPEPGVVYSATRSSSAGSQFGSLGGEWAGSADNGTDSCTMSVKDNVVNLKCNTRGRMRGSAQLVVGSDCVISGRTSTGYELSARKRP